MQLPGKIDVLGRHLGTELPHIDQGRAPERPDDPGHGHYPSPYTLRTPLKTDDRRELYRLQLAEKGLSVSDPWVPRDGCHAREAKVGHHVLEDIWIGTSVRVYDEQYLSVCAGDRVVERHRLALVHLLMY